jgi:beta-galactosidase
VWCHTNLERVELFLNGTSLGAQDVARNTHVAWTVPYQAGVLEARGYHNGAVALVASRETTGAAAGIVLRADRAQVDADGEDVVVLEVAVVDAQGRVVPTASNEIAFGVSGPGRIIGVGNGDPSSHEADKADRRSSFNGMCAVIVQSLKKPGELRIDANSAGLRGAAARVQCRAVPLRASVEP